MSDDNTEFNAEYVFSVVCGLGSAYLIEKKAPGTHPIIKFFFVPILVTWLILMLINTTMPSLTRETKQFGNYVSSKTLDGIDKMQYLQIFPPLFAVLVIFIILLYNRNFDQSNNSANRRRNNSSRNNSYSNSNNNSNNNNSNNNNSNNNNSSNNNSSNNNSSNNNSSNKA